MLEIYAKKLIWFWPIVAIFVFHLANFYLDFGQFLIFIPGNPDLFHLIISAKHIDEEHIKMKMS
jgi:hypothetical protein